MTQLHWIITSIILVIYAIVLYYITGKNRDADKLIWAFGIIAIAGFGIHEMFAYMSYSTLKKRTLH